ncbi:MAG: phosphate transporter permease PtsA [Caulobacteraceae bacterium]|jgi:phosphate transport system permease protein|nr:phosphate transporter permease PtsA [Caulobacteraceae bacterium]
MAVSPSRIASRRAGNVLFVAFCVLVTFIALAALALILYSLVSQGVGGLNLNIFTKSTPAAGTPGGLINAIVGSILMSVAAMIIALTIGILAGTWLAEYAGESRFGSVVRFLNDVLLSAPSILIGLFVYEILVAPFKTFSGFAGSVALALLAAPVITRTTEDVLKLQPTALRESGVALGAPVWHVIRTILWRGSTSGILTGALLAFARISGETAPLLFTALNNQFFSWNMARPMASLPVVIFQDALTPYPDLNRLAWAGALLIAASVLAVTIIARAFSQEPRR